MNETMNRKTEIAGLKASRTASVPTGNNSDGADIQFAAIFRGEPRLLVNISHGEGEEGRLAVKLGIQGHMVMVPRGVTVALPKSYVDLLGDLVVGETNMDATDGWSRPRFSYSVLGPAPTAKASESAE